MSDKIFGYDWEDIQRAQQGGRLGRVIDTRQDPHASDAQHLESDIKLLEQYGVDGLREKQYFGVLDRLERAGRLP